MKKKQRLLVVLLLFVLLTVVTGMTYSMFNSGVTANSGDQNIAKFIFEAESSTELQLPLVDLNPGDTEEYLFSVSNNALGVLSEVSIEYQLEIRTYHLIPLVIELYSVKNEVDTLVLTCNETYERNAENEILCDAPIENMGYDTEMLDNYKLKVEFPIEYNDVLYSNLVDYIDIEITSWQKIGE